MRKTDALIKNKLAISICCIIHYQPAKWSMYYGWKNVFRQVNYEKSWGEKYTNVHALLKPYGF